MDATTIIIVSLTVGAVSAASTWYIARKIHLSKHVFFITQAKAKAKAIEAEAKEILQNAKQNVQDKENELKQEFDRDEKRLKKEYEQRIFKLDSKEEQLEQQYEKERKAIEGIKEETRRTKEKLEQESKQVASLIKDYEQKTQETRDLLSKISGLTQAEAKEELLRKVEETSRLEMANIIRKYENEAKQEAKKRANFILAVATSRFAGDFTSERLINTVTFSSDDFKGRIIGKEGRNIKSLEQILGVDIIIDDTPGAIVVSSFNLYRRAIAVRVLEILIEDGRIHPARIEEIYKKVTNEFEDSLYEEGKDIVLDLGIKDLAPELIKMVGKLKYRASYGQNALSHSLEVAYLSGLIAADLGADVALAKRAGLLHDIGKALTHEFEGSHVDLGAEVCKRYKEPPEVINAIYAHHGHEEPLSIEAAAVCTSDVLSAGRPGARREVLESFLKRVKEIEAIAMDKRGVSQAYAISAGRELRVIANAKIVSDNESVLLSKEIAEQIKNNVQFPGEIKVIVIRETRAVEYAK